MLHKVIIFFPNFIASNNAIEMHIMKPNLEFISEIQAITVTKSHAPSTNIATCKMYNSLGMHICTQKMLEMIKLSLVTIDIFFSSSYKVKTKSD